MVQSAKTGVLQKKFLPAGRWDGDAWYAVPAIGHAHAYDDIITKLQTSLLLEQHVQKKWTGLCL